MANIGIPVYWPWMERLKSKSQKNYWIYSVINIMDEDRFSISLEQDGRFKTDIDLSKTKTNFVC